jgi:hypothetical protein
MILILPMAFAPTNDWSMQTDLHPADAPTVTSRPSGLRQLEFESGVEPAGQVTRAKARPAVQSAIATTLKHRKMDQLVGRPLCFDDRPLALAVAPARSIDSPHRS